MKTIRRLDRELNELGWWGNWANLQWLEDDAYLLSSKEMPEVFFNRGGLTDCRSTSTVLVRLEEWLIALGRAPAVMAFESCHQTVKSLSKAGYHLTDRMIVMEAKGRIERHGDSTARTRESRSTEKWSKAYLTSFYGDLGLLPVTRKIVERVAELDSVTLLEAEVGGTLAGVLALFRTKGLVGAYCVGTVPRFRKRGVAGALLNYARDIASSEKRELILQTLESDGARSFYERRGFSAVYTKALMKKKGY